MTLPTVFGTPSPVFGSRRNFLQRAGNGFGSLALAGLLAQEGRLVQGATTSGLNPLVPHAGHFPGEATSVIWLFMNGAPLQVDTHGVASPNWKSGVDRNWRAGGG